jgi:hypothetical protein
MMQPPQISYASLVLTKGLSHIIEEVVGEEIRGERQSLRIVIQYG